MNTNPPIEPSREGTVVLHYRVVRRISSGGIGVVYHAHDMLLDRSVVLKFLRVDFLENAEAKERFVREALALSTLNHPNIASFLGLEDTEAGIFIVLEYIEGKVFANIYGDDEIVIIDPENGKVTGKLNMQGLLDESSVHNRIDVFNGIAWYPDRRMLYVTGKYWPSLFEVSIRGQI